MEVGATAPGCELGPVPPGKAHDWTCGGTQQRASQATAAPPCPRGCQYSGGILSTHVLGESIRVWGAVFGPAPRLVLPTEMLVGTVLATTEVPRALHKGRQASRGQEGAQACCQGAGPLSRALQ